MCIRDRAIDPAWYISAMLLSMFILYPLLLLLRDKFTYIIAPLASIVIYGYLLFRVGNLATINPLEGSFVYTGLLRGIAGKMCIRDRPKRIAIVWKGFFQGICFHIKPEEGEQC